jgi:hypothetical protein
MQPEVVWFFDPEARGLGGVFSLEIESASDVAWLRIQIRRLKLDSPRPR